MLMPCFICGSRCMAGTPRNLGPSPKRKLLGFAWEGLSPGRGPLLPELPQSSWSMDKADVPDAAVRPGLGQGPDCSILGEAETIRAAHGGWGETDE